MVTIDLSHRINGDMPVYPGTEKPSVIDALTIEKNGFAEKLLTMYSHTGTHVDAPAHMVQGGNTLDRYDESRFFGRGVLIHAEEDQKRISLERVKTCLDKREKADFALLNTGWSAKWGTEEYFRDFPVLDKEAAEYLADYGLKGVGVDCISIDPVGSRSMENHRAILGKDVIIIENLCHLEKLIDRDFLFSCFPLPIEEADGSPVRAVAHYDR